MDVTIIIPVYNVEAYIARCIQSVMSQKSENVTIECIVVDDCTSDRSMFVVREMLSNYSGNISFVLLRHDKNLGLSAARNSGINAATGDFLMFVDSDDYITEDAVEKLWAAHVNYSNADIIVATYFSAKDNKPFYNGVQEATLVNGQKLRKMLMNYQVTCNACWRLVPKDVVLGNKLYFAEGLLYEDILWCHRLFSIISNAIILPDVIYHYEDNPNSITNTTKEKAIRSVRSYSYNCNEMLNNPFEDVYVDHQLYVLTFLMRALDARRDYDVKGEASKMLDKVRLKLVVSTLKRGRVLLAFFFLITYNPFYTLFRIKWVRAHYYILEAHIRHLTNYLDDVLRK